MSGRLILLVTFLIGYLTTGIRGNGHLTQPTATNVSITRDGCGSTKLCLGDDGCNPAGNVLCSFISAEVVNSNTNVTFQLFGNSSGYLALVLSTNATTGGGLVFVCSRDPFNATRNFLFRTATQPARGGNLTLTNTPNVTAITYFFNGTLNGTFHQCQFTASGLSQAINNNTSGELNVQVSLVRGEVGEDATFFAPNSILFNTTDLVNLARVGADTPTPTTPTTSTTPTTPTTPTPPLQFENLDTPTATTMRITRNGCSSTKLCVGDSGCDPEGNVLCSFISASTVNVNNADVAFELFGNSSGYIALVLSNNVTTGGGLVFVCSRDPFNATRNFFFRTARQSGRGGNLTLTNSPRVERITYNFNRSLNGSFHQCTFTARGLNQAANNRASINFQLSLVSGSVRADGTFDTPSLLFNTSDIVDLATFRNVTANATTASPTVTSASTVTVTTSTTVAGCSSLIHPLTQAIAILTSLLALHLF